MAKRSFSPELLESLRSMVVTKALDALGLHWKRDPDFQPVKDAATIRLHVAVGGQVFDTRADKGGGGAIDLAMHLLRLNFVAAVKRLSSSRVPAFEWLISSLWRPRNLAGFGLPASDLAGLAAWAGSAGYALEPTHRPPYGYSSFKK